MRRAPRRFYFHLSGALDLFRFGVSHLAHSFSFRFRIALRRGTQPRTSLPESRQFLPDFFSLPLGGFASPRSLRDFPRRLFRFRPEVRPAPLHRNICNHTKNDRKIQPAEYQPHAGFRRRWLFSLFGQSRQSYYKEKYGQKRDRTQQALHRAAPPCVGDGFSRISCVISRARISVWLATSLLATTSSSAIFFFAAVTSSTARLRITFKSFARSSRATCRAASCSA